MVLPTAGAPSLQAPSSIDPERGTLEYKIKKFEAPIENQAQLLFRYQESIGIGDENTNNWFHHFCRHFLKPETSPHPMIRHLEEADFLDEKDLASILKSTIPSSLDSDKQDAVPILHRLLLRMGSMPYQLTPDKVLTRRALKSAVIALTRPHPETQWVTFRDAAIPFYDRPKGRRVLFQCLAADHELTPDTKWLRDGFSSRSEARDEDLISVLGRLKQSKQFIRHRDTPFVCIARRAPLPQRQNLPSSRSTDLDGRIPIADLKVLLKLLHSVAKYESSKEKERKQKEDRKALDAAGEEQEATASALGRTVGWGEFKKLCDDVPILFQGYKTLLSPFLEGPYSLSDLESKSKAEALEFVRSAYEQQHHA